MNASTGESITSLALFANLRRSFDVLLLSRSGNLYDWKFVLAIFTELIILLNHWCTKWERAVFFSDPFWKGHMVAIELWSSSDHLEGGQVVVMNEVSYRLRHDVSRWAGAGKHLEIFIIYRLLKWKCLFCQPCVETVFCWWRRMRSGGGSWRRWRGTGGGWRCWGRRPAPRSGYSACSPRSPSLSTSWRAAQLG